jgi:glycosyltransferase involved in cell wall biosynthesis
MKIAQVVCVYPPYGGGIGTSAYKNQEVFQRKHESFVFTKKNKKEKNTEENIISLEAFPGLGHAGVLWQLLKKLKNFDLIYFHYPFFGTAFIIWLFKTLNPQKKLIIHYHMDVKHKNILFKILSWPENLIKKSLFKKADKIVCASLDYIENSQIKKYYKLWPSKFTEIPFFVDTNKFFPDFNKKNKKEINEILFIGGLDKAHYFKGVDILIQAFSQANLENTKLLISGEGELKKEYQKLSKDLNTENKVEFIGKLSLEELINHYQKTDVLVLPSINSNEAFGIVLIEAMACATPVIASDLPGVRSVFEDNISGLKVEPKNIKDLKNKLTHIIKNTEVRNKMSKEARILAEKKYSKEVFVSKIEEVLI